MIDKEDNKSYSERLASVLKKAIKESGISKSAIAEACNVSPQAVYGWITKGRVKKEHLLTLSKILGIDIESLMLEGIDDGDSLDLVEVAAKALQKNGYDVKKSPRVKFKRENGDNAVFVPDFSVEKNGQLIYVDHVPHNAKDKIYTQRQRLAKESGNEVIVVPQNKMHRIVELMKAYFDESKTSEPMIAREDSERYNAEIVGEMSLFKPVPIVGTARLGNDGDYSFEQIDHDMVLDVPSKDSGACALRVIGDSMHPAIRHGWYVVIEPSVDPRNGLYVAVETYDGRRMVKELLGMDNDVVRLDSVNPTHGRTVLNTREVKTIQAVTMIVQASKARTITEDKSDYFGLFDW
jgi:phage repressor protein C with HTH and peptisase S24 domain/transcriptional regulator with XRE-family HTH domain